MCVCVLRESVCVGMLETERGCNYNTILQDFKAQVLRSLQEDVSV